MKYIILLISLLPVYSYGEKFVRPGCHQANLSKVQDFHNKKKPVLRFGDAVFVKKSQGFYGGMIGFVKSKSENNYLVEFKESDTSTWIKRKYLIKKECF